MPSAGPIVFAPAPGCRDRGNRSSDRRRARSCAAAAPRCCSGRVDWMKLRNCGVSTMYDWPRAPVCRRPFVRREEEQLVLDDRTAEAVAELVLVELRHRGLEHVLRRQLIALEVVRAAAAELVRAGLGDDLHLRAWAAAVDGGEVVGDDAHFLDRLRIRREVGDAAAGDAVGARLVDGVVVGLVALTAGVDARRRFTGERVVGAAAAADRRRYALAGYTRLERDQVVEISAAERHLLELEAVDASGHAALLGLDDRRRGRDGHALLRRRTPRA